MHSTTKIKKSFKSYYFWSNSDLEPDFYNRKYVKII
jgi:hypothetical protein